MIRRLPAFALLALLSACASGAGDYPSLAIRPAERVSGTLQPAPSPPAPVPVPQETLASLSQLTADAAAAHKAFVEQAASARSVIGSARGAAVGDDSWARAEAALADVRAARSKTMIPLAELDRLYVDAGAKLLPTEAIGAARDQVGALVASEDAAVAELSANLR